MKNFKNIFILLVVALVGLQLTACSEDDYNTNPYGKSGVNLLAFGPSPNTRSQEIRITGTNLNKVDKVLFAGGTIERAGQTLALSGAEVEKSAFNSVDNENIYVNIPEETVPGNIRLVAGGDTIVSEGILTFEEPIEVTSVSPTTGLNAGDEITIKGDYVYNIAEVVFTSGVAGAPVAAEDFTYVSRKEIRLRVPLAAESGVLTVNDGADWELEWETPMQILTATTTAVTPAETDFGQEIRITGTNLHTVETVMFPGGISADFTVSADNKTITTTVPAETKPGAITLLLFSGAAISTPEFTVPTVSIASATPNNDLVEGDVVTLTGENFDRIKEVQLPGIGAITDYTISGNTLTFTVPADMTDGDVVLVQNANISVSVSVEMRKLFGVIWQGKENLSGWSNWGVFNWDGDKWTKFQEAISGPGELTLHFVALNDDPVFNFRMGDWATPLSNINYPYGDDGNIRPGKDATDLVINLTAEEREKMFADGGLGMVIWGDGIQLQYIKFVGAGAELVLWEGNEDMAGWGNNFTIGSDTSPELAALNPHEGSIVRFYGTATGFEGDNEWQVKIEEGHWSGTYASFAATEHDEFVGWDLEANGGCVKMTLTQAMLDAAYAQQWWGGTFIVHGQNFILTKVTVADL